jgi:hypothetical protein
MVDRAHRITGTVSSPFTRRDAVTGALGAAALLTATRTASAREATPAPDQVSYLFVQACESGVATVLDDAERTYELTLQHASGQTLFFADRPERLAGIVSTDAFLEEVTAAGNDPPNAAFAFSPGDGGEEIEVAVVELTSPSADAEADVISYQVRLIKVDKDQAGDGKAGKTIEPVTELPASFGQATLFIDDMGGTYAEGRTREPDLGPHIVTIFAPES